MLLMKYTIHKDLKTAETETDIWVEISADIETDNFRSLFFSITSTFDRYLFM
jgi:hypothetical protein